MCPSDPPRAALWLSVPDTCLMRGEFEAGDGRLPEVHVILGSNNDDTHLLFEREALRRFVELAQRILGVPVSEDAPIPRTLLESSHGHGVRDGQRSAIP